MEDIEKKIKALRDELNRYNYEYYVLSAPTISDFEFDRKMRELQELEAEYARKLAVADTGKEGEQT